jgi:N6-L-threonylcarbamoyladenine synthase
MVHVLAIETSCDETAAAVVQDGHLVLSDPVATQIDVHRKYGGVVPELASRNHVVDIIPVVEEALSRGQVTWAQIDAVAVTRGPGLVGALLVGLQVAKALAYAADIPLVPVHHLAGHLHAVFLHRPGEARPHGPDYPHVALAVSGGHTALYRVDGPGEVTMMANTRDDAAGEAFDKVARMLGLGYPGGPVIEQLSKTGDPAAHRFTLPRFKDKVQDFSFSGLKTAVLTVLKRYPAGTLPEGQARADLLASFQGAAVAQLVQRTLGVVKAVGCRHIVLVGGVACNGVLRSELQAAAREVGAVVHTPRPQWCTDNAAMIGGAAFASARTRVGEGHQALDRQLDVQASWPLGR